SGNMDLEQALKRVELQVTPPAAARATIARQVPDARNSTGSLAATVDDKASITDPILNDPDDAYRTEVVQALKDAMRENSRSLRIAPADWLTIAARGNDDRPRLAPADTTGRTAILRLRGSDLASYLAGQISRDDALQKIEVRVF